MEAYHHNQWDCNFTELLDYLTEALNIIYKRKIESKSIFGKIVDTDGKEIYASDIYINNI